MGRGKLHSSSPAFLFTLRDVNGDSASLGSASSSIKAADGASCSAYVYSLYYVFWSVNNLVLDKPEI